MPKSKTKCRQVWEVATSNSLNEDYRIKRGDYFLKNGWEPINLSIMGNGAMNWYFWVFRRKHKHNSECEVHK